MAPVASATSDDGGVVATSVVGRGGVMVHAWHVGMCVPLCTMSGRGTTRGARFRAPAVRFARKKQGKPRVCGLPLWTRPTRPVVV